MNKFLLALAFIIICFFPRAPAFAQNPNASFEITWVIPPNSTVLMAKDKTGEVELKELTGAYVKVHQQLQALAPRYTHKYLIINIVRAREMIKQGQHLCSLLLLQTNERKEDMIYGPPLGYILPAGLIMKANKLAAYRKFIEDQTVDFKALMAQTRFRVGAVAGRPFLEPTDSILKDAKKDRVYRYYGEASSEGLLEMVAKNRIDGVLGFFGEMRNTPALVKKTRSFDFFLLKESSDLVPLSLSCGKNLWGERAVQYLSPLVQQVQQVAREEVSNQYKKILTPAIFERYQSKLNQISNTK